MHKSGPLCANWLVTLQKDGHAPEAVQRWAGRVTKRTSPELSSAFSCRPWLGPGWLNGRSSSALPRSLFWFYPPQQKALGTHKEPDLGIVPALTLLLHYKWAHVTTLGAIFTICDYKPESRGQVCLARHCAHPVFRIVAATLQDLNRWIHGSGAAWRQVPSSHF